MYIIIRDICELVFHWRVFQPNAVDRQAVLAALRNMEACNPVLRAQSRATLTHFSG